jgi:hypothetical protein
MGLVAELDEAARERAGRFGRDGEPRLGVTLEQHGQVTTMPENAEVASCLDEKLRDRLTNFGAADWDLKAHSERALAEPLTSHWLQHIVRDNAPAVATDCAPPTGGVTHIELRVHAHPDDPELAVDVKTDRGGKVYRTCVATKLTPVLHDAVAVPRKLPNGTVERYFRIVSDLDTTVSLDVAGVASQP